MKQRIGKCYVSKFDYNAMDLNRRDCYDAIIYKTPHYFFTSNPQYPSKIITPSYITQNKFAGRIEFSSILPTAVLPAEIQYVFYSRYSNIGSDNIHWDFKRKGFDFVGSINRSYVFHFSRRKWASLGTHFSESSLDPKVIEKALSMIGIIPEGMIEGEGLAMRMYALFDKLENGEEITEKIFEPYTY